jgi:hypothetical protein
MQQQQQQQQTQFSGDGAQGARGGASRPPPRPWLQACELPGYAPASQRGGNDDDDESIGNGADSRNGPWAQSYGGGAGQTRRMPASNERLGRALEQLEEIQNSAAHLGQQLRQVTFTTLNPKP